MNRLKLEALASSILIYLIIIVTIFTIALYNPTKDKAKIYTAKKSEVIEVSLGSPSHTKSYIHKKSTKKKSSKKKRKKVVKKSHKKVVKKVRNIKKRVIKKVVKKSYKVTKKVIKKAHKVIKQKPIKHNVNASSLFKNIKSESIASKPVGNSGKSLKKVNKSKGIVNRYFAKVQNTLKSWPAQSNFAGEVVRVRLIIYSTGLFDYTIISRSLNPEFNRSLKAYLEQLKRVGFGAHSNPKPYNVVVEFIAK